MYFSLRGHEVAIVDSLVKRRWEIEEGVAPLIPIAPLDRRLEVWRAVAGKQIRAYIGDLNDGQFVNQCFQEFLPEAIVHYGEQPSAPYSMMGRKEAVLTQVNNIAGTLNVLFAMRAHAPDAHLVKLGTLGEYGTPNIDIEEGFIRISHNGREDTLPFPKQAGSFYHLSKVHDSHNIHFACRVWGLRSTDLNQGIVYGIDTEETALDPELNTSLHYDHIFGTVLNRFCVEAAIGEPLTVYGRGGQCRGILNIRDTIQCVDLSINNPPAPGEYRVFNQFTETFTVRQLAELVVSSANALGLRAIVRHLYNPRVELEAHYYNPKHTKLINLGLKPHLLSNVLLNEMLCRVTKFKDNVSRAVIAPRVFWQRRQVAVVEEKGEE